MLARIDTQRGPWDIVVIGGGATGAGVALDAASRGYSVLLLEQHDFGKGTSSRSTKLVHGGVRYLAQGNLSLVREGLRERAILRANAPHLVFDLALVVPAYEWWERPYYGAGLTLYDLLARHSSFGRSRLLSRAETLARVPAVRPDGLRGGIEYHDGQFDDARLLIASLQTAAGRGACVLNYAPVVGLTRTGDGRIDGVVARDLESARELRAAARVVVNATGAFVDEVRRMADADAGMLVQPSQGIHLVLDGSFLGGTAAIMVPRTTDRRVMFALPWHGHTLLGTTDTPIAAASLEPRARDDEIAFVLETAGRCLRRQPERGDILSVFAGVRPLVRRRNTKETAALSRDHTLRVEASGLVTTTGGKWTTYRRMAEETVDCAAAAAGLARRPCVTASLRIAGETAGSRPQDALQLTDEDVRRAVRDEMARTVEDVLARRCRALFLNAAAARDMAPRVAALMAAELGRDETWQRDQIAAFTALASEYLVRQP
jgi:glycerol-3-phosphate dehydrogenase